MSGKTFSTAASCAAFAALALAATAAAAPPAVTIPHYSIYTYTAKIGIKGGQSLNDPVGGPSNGDTVTVQLGGSYSFDARMRGVYLYRGTGPRTPKNTGTEYAKAVVNGTWTATGTKWTDVANKITAPFTCTGVSGTTVQPQMQLAWKPSGSRLQFRLNALQQELWNLGFDACPPDNGVSWMQANSPAVFKTRFSVPASSIGRRTITATVSGPLQENRKYFLQNCPSPGSCSLAWQGTVRLTRTKVIRIG